MIFFFLYPNILPAHSLIFKIQQKPKWLGGNFGILGTMLDLQENKSITLSLLFK